MQRNIAAGAPVAAPQPYRTPLACGRPLGSPGPAETDLQRLKAELAHVRRELRELQRATQHLVRYLV
jgi:hypothetical protein